MNKTDIRSYVKSQLNSMTEADRASASLEICRKLFDLPCYKAAQSVFLYYATSTEVATQDIIRHALSCGKKVFLPKIFDGKMCLVQYVGDALIKGTFGIWEPVGEPYAGIVDLAVIPLVAFDACKNRLGHGGGYYDRFLAGFKGTSVALAFEAQRVGCVPCLPHDVKPDMIITEKVVL